MTYEQLVASCALGKAPTAGEIVPILQAAGKTSAQFVRDIQEERDRQARQQHDASLATLNLTCSYRSSAAKRQMVSALLTAHPDHANRWIARTAGVSHDLVNRLRRKMEDDGTIVRTGTRTVKYRGKTVVRTVRRKPRQAR